MLTVLEVIPNDRISKVSALGFKQKIFGNVVELRNLNIFMCIV